MYNRKDRVKLYKHRKEKGFTLDWTYTDWNKWFVQECSTFQDRIFNEMLEDKGEEKMDQIMKRSDTASWYFPVAKEAQLGCCPSTTCAPTPAAVNPPRKLLPCGGSKKQEEEQKMSYNQIDVRVAPAASNESEIATQRKFLAETLYNLYWNKRNSTDLRRAFGLEDDETPKTVKERKARIAADKFIIDFDYDDGDFDEDEEHYGLGRGHIRWRDPAVKEDQAGLTAVQKLIDAENTKTQRIIQIKDADTGLAAVEAFEQKTFH